MRVISILAASLFLGACALFATTEETVDTAGAPRVVGTIMDPYCLPDGSIVRFLYPNSEGSFEGAKASRENCPWNQ